MGENDSYALKATAFLPALRTKFFRIRSKFPYRRLVKVVDSATQLIENSNRLSTSKPSKLAVEIIPHKGRGIVCSDWFIKGEYVVPYVGELLSRKDGLKREKGLIAIDSDASFLYFFSYNTTRYCLDATFEDGSFGRLVNHSRLRPNCHAHATIINGRPGIVIVASRDIVPGEEIVYDYGELDPEKLKENPWITNS